LNEVKISPPKGEDEGGYRVRIVTVASSPVSSFTASIVSNIGIKIGNNIASIVSFTSYLVVLYITFDTLDRH
jgi:hypothetical protein